MTAAVWAITGLAFAIIGLIIWTENEAGGLATSASSLLVGLAWLLSFLAFVLSGAVIASRQPWNVIGWLLIVPGLSASLAEVINNWLLAMDPPGAPPPVRRSGWRSGSPTGPGSS